LSKSSSGQVKIDKEKLRKGLLSIGADKGSVESLIVSKSLSKVVIPIYWKDGIVKKVSSLYLPGLPDFLTSFEKEFPDGQIRWDPDYEGERPDDGDVAIRVYFDYQEDDQGDHWSPKPTEQEEESYYKRLRRLAYKGSDPVPAHRIVHEK
jgi:hypothetical protein